MQPPAIIIETDRSALKSVGLFCTGLHIIYWQKEAMHIAVLAFLIAIIVSVIGGICGIGAAY